MKLAKKDETGYDEFNRNVSSNTQYDYGIPSLDSNSSNIMPYLCTDGLSSEEVAYGEYSDDLDNSNGSECGGYAANIGSFETIFDKCVHETAGKLSSKYSMFRDNIGIFLPLLHPMELIDASKSLDDSLQNTLQSASTSSQNTKTTSISPTSAQTRIRVVDAVGYNDRRPISDSGNLTFADLRSPGKYEINMHKSPPYIRNFSFIYCK